VTSLEERNRLARECSDLRDQLARERGERAEEQERWAKQWAEELLAGGKQPAEVTDIIYEDSHKVLETLKDRLWWNGYVEGIRSARNSLDEFLISEKQEQEAGP
jgi:hypothetical protein